MANPISTYVLLVDDLEENLVALEGLLRSPGLVLLKARSGSEALELLLRHEVALALVDVQMPEMNGFELAELMRGTERTRRVPIIFLTAGNADWQRRFRGYEAGAVDFIQKPIEPHVLKSKAEVFVALYQQRIEVERLLAESRRQAAALQAADQRKNDFLAMLAHELRNPLAPVRNAVEILRFANSTDDDLHDAREVIARQINHMGRLIDDLLDVARISRGKMALRPEPCDLTVIVRQTAEDYRAILSAAEISLEVEIPNEPLHLNGDPTRLAQIVGNLLHNAAKFTQPGGRVRISVEQNKLLQANVTVADNGTGMDSHVLANVFEPFSQASQSLARTSGGLGLGLALTKGLAELHGGSVTAQSQGLNTGATFVVTLPLSQPVASNHRPQSLDSDGQVQRRLRILIVEDNQDTAKTMQMLLAMLGHDVEAAGDGESGIALARSFRPDVVISDLGLPGEIDGFGIATLLRRDSSITTPFLVALSGYGQDEDRQRSKAAGFEHHLVKPADLKQLQAALSLAARRETCDA